MVKSGYRKGVQHGGYWISPKDKLKIGGKEDQPNNEYPGISKDQKIPQKIRGVPTIGKLSTLRESDIHVKKDKTLRASMIVWEGK